MAHEAVTPRALLPGAGMMLEGGWQLLWSLGGGWREAGTCPGPWEEAGGRLAWSANQPAPCRPAAA